MSGIGHSIVNVSGKKPLGSAINTGELVINEVDKTLWFKDTTGNVSPVGSGLSQIIKDTREYVASAGQTTFAAVYEPGYVQVTVNGFRMSPSDFDGSSGTEVILNVPSEAGDSVFIEAYSEVENQPLSNLSIGNINNPLLDLPLNNSLAMKQGVGSVTFTRASTKPYTDMYGSSLTADINEPTFSSEGLGIDSGDMVDIEWKYNLPLFSSATIVLDLKGRTSGGFILYMRSSFNIAVYDTSIYTSFGVSFTGDFTGDFRLAMVMDNDTCYIYKNGLLMGSGTIALPLPYSKRMYLGNNDSGTGGAAAYYSNFRIYDRVLTEEEVRLV